MAEERKKSDASTGTGTEETTASSRIAPQTRKKDGGPVIVKEANRSFKKKK